MPTGKSWRPSYLNITASRRRLLAGTGMGAAGALLLAACGGSSSGTSGQQSTGHKSGSIWFQREDHTLPDETANAVPGGTYPAYLTDVINSTLDHVTETNENGIALGEGGGIVYQSFLAYNRGTGIVPGTAEYGRVVGQLAQSWEISPDAAQYTFKLRPNVKFHNIAPVNGRTMTMEDVRSSYERFIALGLFREMLVETVDRVEYPDASTMVMKMKYPYAPLAVRLTTDRGYFPIVPKELNENKDLVSTTPIGTGPKMITKYEPSVIVEYRKHQEYWNGAPFIDRWNYAVIPEYANAYAQYVTGNILDFVPNPRDVVNLRKDSPNSLVVLYDTDRELTTNMKFGLQRPDQAIYKDKRIRVALRRAADWDGITAFLANQQQLQANGIPIEITPMTHLNQNLDFWLNPNKGELGKLSENYLFNVAEAKKLAAAAGYPDGFDLNFVTDDSPAAADRVELVKNAYDKAGVARLKLERLTNREFKQTVNVASDFFGMHHPSGSSGNDPDYLMFRYYHRPGWIWTDEQLMSLAQAQRKTADPQARMQILKDIQHKLAEEMFLVPAQGYWNEIHFQQPWLHNVHQVYHNENKQWLDKDMPRRNG